MADSRLVVTVTETGSDKVNRKLKDVGKTGKSVEKQAESMSDMFKQFGSSASQAIASVDGPLGGISSRISSVSHLLGSGPIGLAGAAAAAASAIGAMTIAASYQIRELSTLSQLAGQTTHEFQAMGYVASQFGLNDISDKFKDVKERVGEFVATGGGGLQDFADVMGMTTDQTLALAREMENLTGEQVLKKLVADMEAAGVSTSQMSFALEGVASDLTVLIPSLRDGASEFDRLKQNAENFTSPLTDEDIKNYKELAENVDLARLSFSSMIDNALTPFLPLMNDATLAVADFFATLNQGTVSNIKSKMEDLNDLIMVTEKAAISQGVDPLSIPGKGGEAYRERKKQYEDLANQLKELQESKIPEKPNTKPNDNNEDGGGNGNGRNWETEAEKKARLEKEAAERRSEIRKREEEAEQNRINAQIEQMKLSMMTEQELFEKKEQWIIDNVANETEQFELLMALNDQYDAHKQALADKDAQRREKEFEEKRAKAEEENEFLLSTIDHFGNALTDTITEGIKGTLSLQDVMKSLANTILSEAVNSVVRLGVEYAKEKLLEISMDKTAATAAKFMAVQQATSDAVRASSMAAANAYASTAAIPIIGPAAAPAAAAAAGAATSALAMPAITAASARMQGGDLSAGVPTLVGERGPEIITSRGNGKVIPHNKIGGSGITGINIVNNNYGEPSKGSVRSASIDEQGVIQIIMDTVPELVSRLAGDPDSDLNVNQQRLYPTARGF